MTMKFTDDDLRWIAEEDRDMDLGIQPFVMHRGSRWAMTQEAMDEFGFVSGQPVSDAEIKATLKPLPPLELHSFSQTSR